MKIVKILLGVCPHSTTQVNMKYDQYVDERVTL